MLQQFNQSHDYLRPNHQFDIFSLKILLASAQVMHWVHYSSDMRYYDRMAMLMGHGLRVVISARTTTRNKIQPTWITTSKDELAPWPRLLIHHLDD
jgi:hypothetical protein